jgi:hypothetical protein
MMKAAHMTGKRLRMDRSALEERLRLLHELNLEERDRRGYEAQPQRVEEYRAWEDAAAWPEE